MQSHDRHSQAADSRAGPSSAHRTVTMCAVPHVDVCVCTFRRPPLLRSLLNALNGLRTDGRFTYSIIVADNDAAQPTSETVSTFRRETRLDVVYCVEPVQNLALV